MKTMGLRRFLAAALCLVFSTTPVVCFAFEGRALKVGDENAQINVSGWDAGLYVVAIDPEGKRAGTDFETKEHLEEFEASFDIMTSETIKWINSWNDLYGSEGAINLVPGTYTIEVLGTALTKYSIGISISRRLPGQSPIGIDRKTLQATPEQLAAIRALSTDLEFEGIIDNGLTAKYRFTYTSDPTQPAATAVRVLGTADLKQDIELSRKMGWIDSDGVAKSLMKKAEAIEEAIARGDRETAANQLNAFINEVDAQKGKHIESYTEEPGQRRVNGEFVDNPKEGKAVKLLLDDARYLLDNL